MSRTVEDSAEATPGPSAGDAGDRNRWGAPGPVRVLFLCTHNKARSQLAEGLTRHLAGGRIEAFSAGSEPSEIHPQSVRALAARGIDASGQRSKHMNELAGERFDYVVTVCDRVREVCPVFPNSPRKLHWSLPDPAAVTGPPAALALTFEQVARQLEIRIRQLIAQIEAERCP